jgi:hypothetical protein
MIQLNQSRATTPRRVMMMKQANDFWRAARLHRLTPFFK